MIPPAEHVHWLFATGFLILGLLLLTEAIVGREVWRRRAWRAYLWPGAIFVLGVLLWPVMLASGWSAIHMFAHGWWAQVMMLAGGAELALVRGKLRSRYWMLLVPLALASSGAATLVHEQAGWFFARSQFVHHLAGWATIAGAIFPLGSIFRPRSWLFNGGYAVVIIAAAVILYTDRDLAPIFGHLSPAAGVPHR